MRFVAKGVKAMGEPARALAKLLAERRVALISGPVGAGKTTLARLTLREMGYEGSVVSPTFTIASEYKTERGTVYHLDLHRLSARDAASGLLDDYLSGEAVALVEWPEQAPPALWPKEAVRVVITANGAAGERVVEIV